MKTMQMYDLYEKNNFIKTGEELMRLKKSKIAERHNICRDDEVKSLYLKNKLEHMHLKEFKDIKLEEWLYIYWKYYFRTLNINIVIALKYLVRALIKGTYIFTGNSQSKKILISTSSYSGRNDYISDQENLLKCMGKDAMHINYSDKYVIKRSLFTDFVLAFSCILQMCKAGIGLKDSIFLSSMIIESNSALICIKDYFCKSFINPRIVCVFCDFHAVDYFIIQYFNSLNIETVTLQHGIYDHKAYYHFMYSRSNHFLAINDYTKKIAFDIGFDVKKMNVCGPLKAIGQEQKDIQTNSNGIIGVCLTGTGDDPTILDYIGKIDDDYSLIIRPHPFSSLVDMSSIRHKKFTMDDVGKHSLYDFSVLCDLIITGGNSTVFSDLVGKGIPVVRIIVNGDTYEEVKELKIDKYSDLKEWIDLYYSDIDRIKGIVKKNKAYFMPVEDVGGLYKAFRGLP